MDRTKTLAAIAEAERFIRFAEAVIRQDDEALAEQRKADKECRRAWFSNIWYGTKETGAMRRASLDLTRTLADLRRRS